MSRLQDLGTGGELTFRGERQHRVIRRLGPLADRQPPRRLSFLQWVLANWHRSRQGQPPIDFQGEVAGVLTFRPALYGRVYHADWSKLAPWQAERLRDLLRRNHPVLDLPRYFGGAALDLGLLSTRVVTTAGVNFMVDAFQNTAELENFKFHGYGTGGAAEGVGNTALTTELTTEYASDNVRPTGSQGEGASANVYRTTATLSPDSGGTLAITEHGIFDQAATGGGTLWDRSLFAAVNLVAGSDSLQTQYDLTCTAGG